MRCDVGAVVRRRVRKAFELRNAVVPSFVERDASEHERMDERTTTYRLVNAEGDRLSGACVDAYRDASTDVSYAAVSSSSAWTQRYRDEIVRALGSEADIDVVVWRVDEGRWRRDREVEGAERAEGADESVSSSS